LPSRWWCSFWSVSAGIFFFDHFCGGIVCCFSTETRLAPMLGCPKIRMKPPNTSWWRVKTFKYTDDTRGDKESPKDWSNLKSCESFYTCPRAPFYRETKRLYITKVPSDSRNIPKVNMYMNVFYISYIYKPTTSSHIKPGLFEMTSLTWLPTDSSISPFRKSSYTVTSELEL
jgi:hypothetical protein